LHTRTEEAFCLTHKIFVYWLSSL